MGSKEEIPRGGRIKARRIYLILDGLENGLSYDQIQLRFNHDKQGFYGDFRGECSVANVKRAIAQLPLSRYHITDVVEIPQYSYEDNVKKHDLEIVTDDQCIGVIGVQVKSSNAYISKFYRHLSHDLNTAKEIAIQRKLIVLNGSLESHLIERSFVDQFQNICQHFKPETDK